MVSLYFGAIESIIWNTWSSWKLRGEGCCPAQGADLDCRRRLEFQILGDILRLGRAGKTEIALFANLGHLQLEKYLGFLVGAGFMEKEDHERPPAYRVTPRGVELLETIERVSADLGLDTSASI